MITEAFEISLKILGVYILLSEGYVLHFIKRDVQATFDWLFGLKAAAVITAPLFNCFVCMSSVWTLVLGFEFSLQLFSKMITVLAFNYIINCFHVFLTGEDL